MLQTSPRELGQTRRDPGRDAAARDSDRLCDFEARVGDALREHLQLGVGDSDLRRRVIDASPQTQQLQVLREDGVGPLLGGGGNGSRQGVGRLHELQVPRRNGPQESRRRRVLLQRAAPLRRTHRRAAAQKTRSHRAVRFFRRESRHAPPRLRVRLVDGSSFGKGHVTNVRDCHWRGCAPLC
jgi:hypothetical protein